ncbi:MAG: NCS2 family permease [Clostridiales bacterium]|nr:NCS2 family permease [Clostridiales bacterium]
MGTFLNNFFHIHERNSSIKTEIIAGVTTFATMAYILAVNGQILSDAGLDQGAVIVATALGSVVGTIAMGLLANMPFALAPGMGLNAFFAYTVVLQMGYSPSFALAAVLLEGLLFIILSATKIRTKIFNAIPLTLKYAVGGGVGLFIIFIGMQNSGIVQADSATLVKFGSLSNPGVAIALIGLAITIVLLCKNVKGALLLGICAAWLIGVLAQITGLYQVDIDAGRFSLIPSAVVSAPPSLSPTLGLCFKGLGDAFSSAQNLMNFLVVMLSFLFVDIFDTIGCLGGVAIKANMLDDKGELPNSEKALLADAIGTTAGAILGTSTVTTYLESAAGVGEGGRTGMTSIVVSIFFLLSLFFSPLFLSIPSFATATALMAVGIFMLEPIKHVDLTQLDELIPTSITLITMPLFYSISYGLIFGTLAYIITKCAAGKRECISPLIWVLGVVFVLKLIFLG